MSLDPWQPEHPLIGRVLQGRFQVASFICEGGMAQVFCGIQDEEPRHVAIKVMHPELADDHELVQRFLREAHIASRLSHPNIVRIVSIGEDKELLFIVMELLYGDDLSARVKQKGSFTEARSVEIMADVFGALQFAHERGVLHRDIKPENVMLCRDPSSPEREVVKVLDFGIAKILDQTDSVSLPDEAPTGFRSVLTRVGGWVGTPGYMSPEQGSAEKLDHRSDLYSAGCLLYELLTGRLPFEGQTALQIIARHVREAPPAPSTFAPVHPDLERLVMRLLAKKPQDRPSTARDVADELLLLLGELEAPSSQRWQYYDSNSLAYAAAPPEPAPRPSVPPPSREAPKSAAGVDSTLRSAVEDQANLRQLRRTLHMDVPNVQKAVEAATRPAPARPVHPLVGRVLGGSFQVSSLMREGSVSQIFAGLSNQEPQHVAIKILNPEHARDAEVVRRFIREGQAAMRLTHPNIVRTVFASEDQGIPFFVMELLFGDDLSARIKQRGAYSQDASVAIAVQLCKALEHAHQMGIVHRDIKPENIMVCRQPSDPAREVVKVLDFGTAKIFDAKSGAALPSENTSVRSQLTRVGALVGSPMYMSPEQGRAEPVDARSDLYSVGVVLYELLCGRTPFQGETPLQIVARHVHETPPPLSSLASVPRELERIVMRCLEKSPANRPQSAIELAALLETALPDVTRSTGGNSAERWKRRSMRGMAPEPAQAPTTLPQTALPQTALPTAAEPRAPMAEAASQSSAQAPARSPLKSTLPLTSTLPLKRTNPLAAPATAKEPDRARSEETFPSFRLASPPAQAAPTTSDDRVNKLIRLVTILLVLLVVACVAIGIMLYVFVKR
jgi:serine/threonine-protein kinase